MAKTLVGTVVSDKSDKTITVKVISRKTHPIYRKQYMASRKFTAHDENNEAAVGDKVAIIETRPLSATKRFKLDKILEKPALNEEALSAAKSEDTGKEPTKSKSENEQPVAEAAPTAPSKPAAKTKTLPKPTRIQESQS